MNRGAFALTFPTKCTLRWCKTRDSVQLVVKTTYPTDYAANQLLVRGKLSVRLWVWKQLISLRNDQTSFKNRPTAERNLQLLKLFFNRPSTTGPSSTSTISEPASHNTPKTFRGYTRTCICQGAHWDEYEILHLEWARILVVLNWLEVAFVVFVGRFYLLPLCSNRVCDNHITGPPFVWSAELTSGTP